MLFLRASFSMLKTNTFEPNPTRIYAKKEELSRPDVFMSEGQQALDLSPQIPRGTEGSRERKKTI